MCEQTAEETTRDRNKTDSRQRTCRPRKTSERVDFAIRRSVMKYPFITAAEIKHELTPNVDNITTRTIQMKNKFKMPAKRPIRKPVIILAARRKRLSFCKAHETWTVEQWMVMFSDNHLRWAIMLRNMLDDQKDLQRFHLDTWSKQWSIDSRSWFGGVSAIKGEVR